MHAISARVEGRGELDGEQHDVRVVWEQGETMRNLPQASGESDADVKGKDKCACPGGWESEDGGWDLRYIPVRAKTR